MYTIKKQHMYTYKIYNDILTLHQAYTIIRVQGNWNQDVLWRKQLNSRIIYETGGRK